MTTVFAAALRRVGLSHSQFAKIADVRIDTVNKWASGRNRTPDFVWSILRAYESQIVDRSEEVRKIWKEKGELRHFDVEYENDIELLAYADFILSCDDDGPIPL